MITRLDALALAACLTLPVIAPPTVAQTGGSPLVIKTASKGIAYVVLDRFGAAQELPALEQGMHYELSFDDGGTLSVGTDQGLIGMMQIEARPAELMDLFAEEAAAAKGMAQGFGVMALQQAGLDTREGVKIMRGVLNFPEQIALARLIVKGDPDRPRDGIDAQLWLEPTAGSWFAGLVGALKPTSKGVPVIDDPGALMSMTMNADFAAAAEYLAPFNEIMAAVGTKSKEDARMRVELLDQYWQALDGTMAMSWNIEGGGMTSTLRRLQPTTIDDLAAIIALYRPGPMQHIDRYIATKHGREQPAYPHPKLERIWRETHGRRGLARRGFDPKANVQLWCLCPREPQRLGVALGVPTLFRIPD